MGRFRRSTIAACVCAFSLMAGVAEAQAVRGLTVDDGQRPLAGVVVLLLDSASNIAARALSNEAGAFRLAASNAGVFRIRTLRIGYVPVTGELFRLSRGEETTQRVVLTGLPMTLETVRVSGRRVCGTAGDSAEAAFAIWEQARTALMAAELTAEGHTLATTTVAYERTLDPGLTSIRRQSADVRTEVVARPWRTLSPDSLHTMGYVAVGPDSQTTIYYAPGLDALASPLFVQDHCFRLDAPSNSTRVAVSFEPTSDRRRVAEVSGTLWLDRGTMRLLELEFQYVNIPRALAGRAKGTMAFASLSDGGWVVSRWNIQMPVVAAVAASRTTERSASTLLGAAEAPRVTDVAETGGVLVDVRRGADTLWTHPTMTVTGVVRDSAGAVVRGARVGVQGQSDYAVSDAAGRFSIAGLHPGSHVLTVRTAALDSLGVGVAVAIVAIDSSTAVSVRVPSARALAKRTTAFSGHVFADSSAQPVVGAEVSLLDLGLTANTNGRGEFRLDHIPAGDHRLVVRHVGYGPLDTSLTFTTSRVDNRTIYLSRLTALDSVVVLATSSGIPTFDEHRKLRLGHFITRTELDKYEGRPLFDPLTQLSGLQLTYNPIKRKYYVTTTRNPNCYVQVYVDRSLVYRGPESTDEPFDPRSLEPGQVEAIEFYASGAETPAEYSGLNSACGVLVIWTRRTP